MWASQRLLVTSRSAQQPSRLFFSTLNGQPKKAYCTTTFRLVNRSNSNQGPECFMCCHCNISSWQPGQAQVYKRTFSSGKYNEIGDGRSIDPDTGDFIVDHASPSLQRKAEGRIKVKFNWKNSLVSAEAYNLLENLYASHPQLVDFDEKELMEYLQRMSIYSVDVERAAKMVIMNPRLIKMNDTNVESVIGALRTIGLSENQRGHIVRQVPELFNFPPKKITTTFSFLKTWLSKDEVVDLICKSFEILLESEKTLEKKLEYLVKEMSHETKDIVASKALAYPLKHIKMRHEFLVRSGLFKPIPYKKLIKILEKEYKDKNKQRAHYFKPLQVVCFRDEDFLKVCTNNLLTLNELAAFEELHAAELEVMEEEEAEEELEAIGLDAEDYYEDETEGEAVSLVKSPNSAGFFSETESKGCYF